MAILLVAEEKRPLMIHEDIARCRSGSAMLVRGVSHKLAVGSNPPTGTEVLFHDELAIKMHPFSCASDKSSNSHVWLNYAEGYPAYTEIQRLYRKRKESIELVFANAKVKYALPGGLTQLPNWAKHKVLLP